MRSDHLASAARLCLEEALSLSFVHRVIGRAQPKEPKEGDMRSFVKRGLTVALSAAVVCLGSTTAIVRADGPLIGANVGAAFPLSKYRRTIDPDIGGTAGMDAGYRWDF